MGLLPAGGLRKEDSSLRFEIKYNGMEPFLKIRSRSHSARDCREVLNSRGRKSHPSIPCGPNPTGQEISMIRQSGDRGIFLAALF